MIFVTEGSVIVRLQGSIFIRKSVKRLTLAFQCSIFANVILN